MYDIQLVVNNGSLGNTTLRLNPNNGYYITTIDGLTGLNAAFNADRNINGYGESVRSTSIGGRTLQVRGFILDGHTAAGLTAKDNMLNAIMAGMMATLTIYRTPRVTAGEAVQATVYIKASPTITQERHSKFSFQLYMPFPYFESINVSTDIVSQGFPVIPILRGSSDVPYTLEAKASGAKINTATFHCDNGQELRIDFTKSEIGYLPVGASFKFERLSSGELRLTVTSGNTGYVETKCIDLTSDLWRLPRGNNQLRLTVAGETGATYTDGLLKYRRTYENVMVT